MGIIKAYKPKTENVQKLKTYLNKENNGKSYRKENKR